MQNLQEYKSIRRDNYNKIACVVGDFVRTTRFECIMTRMLPLRQIIHLRKSYKTSNLTDYLMLMMILIMVEAMMIVFGGFHDDSVDEGPIDGDSSDDELDDSDFLSQLLCHTKVESILTHFDHQILRKI